MSIFVPFGVLTGVASAPGRVFRSVSRKTPPSVCFNVSHAVRTWLAQISCMYRLHLNLLQIQLQSQTRTRAQNIRKNNAHERIRVANSHVVPHRASKHKHVNMQQCLFLVLFERASPHSSLVKAVIIHLIVVRMSETSGALPFDRVLIRRRRSARIARTGNECGSQRVK